MATNDEIRLRNQTEADELIAEICISTDNEDFKNALKKYRYGAPMKDVEDKLKNGVSSKVDQLKELLAFLYNDAVKTPIPKLKADVAHAIVCRIQNLLPADCPDCNERHRLKLRKAPILPCSKCGQSSHKKCIVNLISLHTDTDNSRMDITNEEIVQIINPLNLDGWHFLCKKCEHDVIPKGSHTQPTLIEPDAETDVQTLTVNVDLALESEPTASSQANPEATPSMPIQIDNPKPKISDKNKKTTCKFYKKGHVAMANLWLTAISTTQICAKNASNM